MSQRLSPLVSRLAASVAVVLLALVASPAAGQSAMDVTLRAAELGQDGATRLVVSVTGDEVDGQVLSADAFEVSENGEPVGAVSVEPIFASTEPTAVTIALLVDTSGSTRGQPLELAKAAASDFVRSATDQGIRVALVAFGPEVEVVVEPTDDPEALASAVAGLEAGGETPLYDAVAAGAELVAAQAGLREIVVFSDGGDTVSQRSLEDAVAAVEAAEAPVSAVALETPELDQAALEEMVAATDGSLLPVENPTVLAAAFEQVAREVASQYVVTYEGGLTGPDELDIGVLVGVGGAVGEDAVLVANPRVTSAPPPAAPPPADHAVEVFASETGLWVGAGAAFTALLMLLGTFLVAPVRTRGQRALEQTLGGRTGAARPDSGGRSSLLSMAADVVEQLPSDERRSDALQSRLERAGWLLRTSEFRVLQIGGPVLGLALGWVLLGSALLGAGLAVVGLLLPSALLSRRIDRRARDFDGQLPDLFQMLAGSLRAGYGLLQATRAVADEVDSPAREELGRVLTEALLGGSVSDALDGMAERMGSEDFRWAVIAINIQRRVGGNLAELLDTIATTVREREELRREVRSQSAEGRLSAWILTALPFLVGGYTAVVNPEYLSVLFESPAGMLVVVIALVLMGVGMFWIRRVVQIEV